MNIMMECPSLVHGMHAVIVLQSIWGKVLLRQDPKEDPMGSGQSTAVCFGCPAYAIETAVAVCVSIARGCGAAGAPGHQR